SWPGPARLMTLHTTNRQVRPDTVLETVVGVRGGSVSWQGVNIIHWGSEVARLAQRRDLVASDAVHSCSLVQLPRIEAQRKSCHRCMARKTVCPRWDLRVLLL